MTDTEKLPLGEYLRSIRISRKLTLRDVEASGIGISNAYLSQLEQGKIAKPSPNFLHKLSTFYQVPYNILMEKAGYISAGAPNDKSAKKSGRLAPSALGALTRNEEEQLLVYLTVLRSRRKEKE